MYIPYAQRKTIPKAKVLMRETFSPNNVGLPLKYTDQMTNPVEGFRPHLQTKNNTTILLKFQ